MASRDGVILEVARLTRSFGALAALTDVSFAVRPREVFSVIGPNGAGKSTLFNVISGLHPPTAGRVLFRGEDITGLPPEVINRRGLAKTFQITSVMQTSRRSGMITLNDALIDLVDAAQVEPKEAYMKATDKTGFAQSLRSRGHDTSFVDGDASSSPGKPDSGANAKTQPSRAAYGAKR